MKNPPVRGSRRSPLDPVDSTPNLRARRPRPIWPSLLLIALIPLTVWAALAAFGQPGLRVEYRYQGTWERPVFERCSYLLLDGSWREVRPPLPRPDACPVIHTFPFHLF